ncbi:MAG TPA: fumarate reductase subunit C [Gammaproteobacteria bacterium]|nr:fumarate reductase subunit C [Gammaproteobacteria bacterium]
MSMARPYTRPVPRTWWLRKSNYLHYMLRELTCVLIGAWSGWLVFGLVALARGAAAWQQFVTGLTSTAGIVFQVAVLVGALYHSATWFALAPRTMPLRLGGRRVPAVWITLGHYLAAALVAVVLLFLGVI